MWLAGSDTVVDIGFVVYSLLPITGQTAEELNVWCHVVFNEPMSCFILLFLLRPLVCH